MQEVFVTGLLIFGFCLSALASDKKSSIGYDSVESAKEALKNDPNATFDVHEGWDVATQTGDKMYVMWTFPPLGHPAYPSVVRREILEKNEKVQLEMKVFCQAKKADCDKLVKEFETLNKKIMPTK